MRTWYGLATAVVLLSLSPRSATVKTRELEYRQGDIVLQGFVAWDDAARGRRPGVLVVHEWWGHNEHARNQARRLAEAGYVGFALDMYGKGKVTTHPQDAQAFASEVTDRKSTRLNSSHEWISYAVFCLKKKNKLKRLLIHQQSHLVQMKCHIVYLQGHGTHCLLVRNQ